MNVFYEDSGKFKVASVVEKNNTSFQVDTQHGKRVKLKSSNVFFEFEQDMGLFLDKAQELSQDIDVNFLWEVAEEEFTVEELGQDYFGNGATTVQLAALLIRIFDYPIYFYKKGKGCFKSAPEEALISAKASIERKRKEQEQKESWIQRLVAGVCPEEFQPEVMKILHCPNKQDLRHQAFLESAQESKKSPLGLARALNLVRSMPEYLLSGFSLKHFTKGLHFPDVEAPIIPELPQSNVKAFSIDDESTTEIDDAFSVEILADGARRIGIHIATPGVAIDKNSDLEKIIFERLSTVYYPGDKITMLPESWGKAFNLEKGYFQPALSLYIDVDSELNVVSKETILEKIWIEENLRIQSLEPLFNKNTLPSLIAGEGNIPYQEELLFLYQLANKFATDRGQNDSKEVMRYDYAIAVDDNQQVSISRRSRGEPIDLIVGELMIHANVHWAEQLNEHKLSAIFRAQSGGKVRLTTEAAEHVGMGVAQYAWCSSPLRRACDYVNQRQLLSLYADYPVLFEPKDSELFTVLRTFDTAYGHYATFQREMEFYYTLQYLGQENITQFEGTYLKEGLIRAVNLPLVTQVLSTPEGWFGKRYLFTIKEIDLWACTIAIQLEKEIIEEDIPTL